jgi:hypothetical protein
MQQFSTITPINRKLLRALEIVEGSDLDYWHALDPADLTTALLRFRNAAWDLREDADDLEKAIRRWVTIHKPQDDAARYAIAEILDAPPQYMS